MVYLPEGEWYDYFTNDKYEGSQYIIVDAPIEKCPIFVKAGSIIPKYPVMQYVGQNEIKEMKFDYYPGEDCEYIHYNDDGESMNYQDGEYNCYKLEGKGNEVTVTCIHKGYAKEYENIVVENIIK